MEHHTLLGTLAANHDQSRSKHAQRRIRTAGSLIFVVAVALLFSACANEREGLSEHFEQPDTATAKVEQADANPLPDSRTTAPTTPKTQTAAALVPLTARGTSSGTTTAPSQEGGSSVETPTTTAYADIEPVLSGTAAKPTPVEITQPTPPVASFMVGATDTQSTITFVADGNGRIDWFSRVLPSGPPTNQGTGSTIDITLTIPITEDARSYLITADGKNPNAGEDYITILLVRGSA